MIEIAGLTFAALAIMFGGFLKGAVGMGAPLVAIPILAGIYAGVCLSVIYAVVLYL